MGFARPTKERVFPRKSAKWKGRKRNRITKSKKPKMQIKWSRFLNKTLSRKLICSGKTKERANRPIFKIFIQCIFILKFTQRQLNKIHFHRSRVQEIVQKQETLNAIECQWKRQQPRAKAKALAYRDRLRYITSIVYFHSGRTGRCQSTHRQTIELMQRQTIQKNA